MTFGNANHNTREKAEAENATLTARVKRLEEALSTLFGATEEALTSAANGRVVIAGGVEAVTHVSFPTTTTEARAIIESARAALAGEGE